jgi:hypothetical protein
LRSINLISAVILIIIALGAMMASDQFYQLWLSNDWYYGQGNWGMLGRTEGDRFIATEIFVTDPGKGRAFFIRFIAVATPALTGFAFLIACLAKSRPPSTSTPDNSNSNSNSTQS